MTKAEALANYQAADVAFNASFAIFDAIRTDYRARKVDDHAFCAAHADHKVIADAFDAAYAIMQDVGEPEVVEIEDDSQLVLL